MNEFFAQCKNDDDEKYVKKVKGQRIKYKDMELCLQGNYKNGYKLLDIKSGLLINGKLYHKLYEFREDIEKIYEFYNNEGNQKLLKEAEIELNTLIKNNKFGGDEKC